MRCANVVVSLVCIFTLFSCYNKRWDVVMGYPEEINGTAEEIYYLESTYFGPSILAKYELTPESEKKALRDTIVISRMRVIDHYFEEFSASIHAEFAISETVSDSIPFAANIASLLTPVTRIKDIISIVSTGLMAGKDTFDKNMFFQTALNAIQLKMIAQREHVKIEILGTLSNSTIAQYPLQKALMDLQRYERAGTFHGAVESIAQDSATTAAIDQEIVIGSLGSALSIDERIEALKKKVAILTLDQIVYLHGLNNLVDPTIKAEVDDMFKDVAWNQEVATAIRYTQILIAAHHGNSTAISKWEAVVQGVQ